jgi:hypothetical protein
MKTKEILDDSILDIFWNNFQPIYLTILMNASLLQSNPQIINYINSIDIKYVNIISLKYLQYTINTNNYDIISKMIMWFKIDRNISYNIYNLNQDENEDIYRANVICQILLSKTIPTELKYRCFYILVHNKEINDIFWNLKNTKDIDAAIAIDNLTCDVIKDINKIHTIHWNSKTMELYLDLIDFSFEHYKKVRTLTHQYHIVNLSNFVKYYTSLICVIFDNTKDDKIKFNAGQKFLMAINTLEKIIVMLNYIYGASHIESVIFYIEEMYNIEKILITHSLIPNPEHIAYVEHCQKIITGAQRKLNIIILTLSMIIDELTQYNIIISNKCNDIIKNLLFVNPIILKKIKILPDDNEKQIDEELIDFLDCNIVNNPFFLPISKNNDLDILIDYRTLIKIGLAQINPFTNEPIDFETIIDFNMTDIKQKARQKIYDKLKILYNSLEN